MISGQSKNFFQQDNMYRIEQKESTKQRSNPIATFLADHLVGIKRLQYALIIAACTVVLGFQVAECIEKYLTKSTGK